MTKAAYAINKNMITDINTLGYSDEQINVKSITTSLNWKQVEQWSNKQTVEITSAASLKKYNKESSPKFDDSSYAKT